MAEWPTTSVTSAEIVDGSIVDADVAAGAAIQASKLSGVETPAGAQSKADDAQAAAEATAATDATTKANAAQTAAEATAAAALTAHNALTDTAHGLPDTSTLIVEGDARLTDERTPTDGSVTAAKLASGQNVTLLGATFTGTVPGSLNAVKFTMSGASATSASTGGVVNITTTGHTGAGLVVYSNRGNDAGGRLVSIWADNAAFNQSAFYCRYDGVANAAVIDNQGSGTSNVALTVTSTNASDTTLGISGTQTTRAVLKITHTGGAGTSGAAITIQKDGTDTAAQGIFGDADATATGKWINLRLGGTEVFVVSAGGNLDAAGTITSGGTAVVLTDDSRLTDARTPTTHAASHAAGGADAVTPLSIAALGLADTRAGILARYWDFDTDPFDTDLGEWSLPIGPAPTVASGEVVPASTANLVALLDAQSAADVKITILQAPAATGNRWSAIAKASADGLNYVLGRTYWASSTLVRAEIFKVVSGSFTQLSYNDVSAGSFSAGAALWCVMRVVGNVITCEAWKSDPALGGAPTASTSYTLTGGDATQFGAGVVAAAGLRTKDSADTPLKSLTIRPLVETTQASLPPMSPRRKIGVWGPAGFIAPDSSLAVTFPGNGWILATPVWSPGGNIDGLGVDVTVAGAAGSVIRLGVYANNPDGGFDTCGGLVVDCGTVAATSTGVKTATFTAASVPSGVVWLVAASQGGAASQPAVRRNTTNIAVGNGTSSSMGAQGLGQGSVTSALPSTLSALGLLPVAPSFIWRPA